MRLTARTGPTCSCSTSTCRVRASLPAIPELAAADRGGRADDAERPGFARRALRPGALGYVLKEAAEAELVQAVRRAAAGDTYLNPRLGARLAAAPAEPRRPTT